MICAFHGDGDGRLMAVVGLDVASSGRFQRFVVAAATAIAMPRKKKQNNGYYNEKRKHTIICFQLTSYLCPYCWLGSAIL